MKKTITIAIQCHNFQKRLCLMLSSLYQQREGDFELVVDVSYLKNNGTPSTESVLDFYSKLGMKIKRSCYEDISRFEFRGYTRNDQMRNCDTDYILFADTDMVYSPKFFGRLVKVITREEIYIDYDGMFICGRYSQPNEKIEETNKFVDSLITNEPRLVPEIWHTVNERLEKVSRSSVGAGFFQLIDVKKCDHKNYYVSEGRTKDRGWSGEGQKSRSDVQFRRRIGKKIQLPKWFWKSQIHINHFRDNQFGKHLEDQR